MPAQQGGHLLRFEQARDPQEVGLLVGSDFGAEPELASVEERPVEGRVGSEGLEAGEGELVAGLLLPVGPFDQIVVQAVLAAAGPVDGVVAFDLHSGGEFEDLGDGRQEHRRGLAAPARPDAR